MTYHYKNFLLAILCIALFAGCNVTNRSKYNAMQHKAQSSETLELENERLQEANMELSSENRKLRSELERLQNVQSKLQTSLSGEINAQQVQISRTDDNRVKITLQQAVLFDTSSILLNSSGMRVLKKIATVLRDTPAAQRVRIVGNTDNRPVRRALRKQFSDNWDLSARRAGTVVRYFV
ncbi:MAG: OmpA family protein, partial [Mariprofundales bacterium]